MGHSRENLWAHLFVLKRRQNPFQEREYQGDDQDDVYNKWYEGQRYMGAYKTTRTLRGIDIKVAWKASTSTRSLAKALMDPSAHQGQH